MISDLKYRHWFENKNGKLIFDDQDLYQLNVDHYFKKRGYICFYDESEGKPISKEDRAYYFKVLIGLLQNHSDFYAMSPIEIHHYLMEFFNGTWIKDSDSKWVIWYPSLSSMDTKNFSDYKEKVEYFIGTKGIVLKPINTYQVGRSPDIKDDLL